MDRHGLGRSAPDASECCCRRHSGGLGPRGASRGRRKKPSLTARERAKERGVRGSRPLTARHPPGDTSVSPPPLVRTRRQSLRSCKAVDRRRRRHRRVPEPSAACAARTPFLDASGQAGRVSPQTPALRGKAQLDVERRRQRVEEYRIHTHAFGCVKHSIPLSSTLPRCLPLHTAQAYA